MPTGKITWLDSVRRIGWISESGDDITRFFGFNESPNINPKDLYIDCQVSYELAPSSSPGKDDKAVRLIIIEVEDDQRELGIVYRRHPDGYSFAKTKARESVFIPPNYNVKYNDFISFIREESEKGLSGKAAKILEKKYGRKNTDMSVTPCQSAESIRIDSSSTFEFLNNGSPVEYIARESGLDLIRQTYAINAFARHDLPALIDELKNIVHPGESWSYKNASEHNPYPILKNYFLHTFERLWDEDRELAVNMEGSKTSDISYHKKIKEVEITESRNIREIAVFNTGLIDKYYREIFCVFKKSRDSTPGTPPYIFEQFAVPGSKSGLILMSVKSLPERARYYGKSIELFFDPDLEIYPDFDHIFERSSRIHLLKYKNLKEADISDDVIEDITQKINNALDIARRKIRWSYKTVIPQYFTTKKKMQFLIPICLEDPARVDLAMAVDKNPEDNAYMGHTILPLEWAYSNARLLTRPESDWLKPDLISFDDE